MAGSDVGDAGTFYAVGLDQRGRILAARWQLISGVQRLAIARLRPGGALDISFSGDGMRAFRADGEAGEVDWIGVDPSARLVFAGYTAATIQVAVGRLRSDGSSDRSFGGNGVVLTAVRESAYGNDAYLDAASRLVVGGSSYQGPNNVGMLLRYLTS
ncbi:MAG: hypothetical protein OEV60_02015 [Actinomycetota bacterium]|nr:hypothetical protein [Actinomycetota bacterium]MDH5223909.1 hypothetical protein [Actinomycetota bacterium]MDH5312376.1 hypothetical protein [Actinomycetota bacterium]